MKPNCQRLLPRTRKRSSTISTSAVVPSSVAPPTHGIIPSSVPSSVSSSANSPLSSAVSCSAPLGSDSSQSVNQGARENKVLEVKFRLAKWFSRCLASAQAPHLSPAQRVPVQSWSTYTATGDLYLILMELSKLTKNVLRSALAMLPRAVRRCLYKLLRILQLLPDHDATPNLAVSEITRKLGTESGVMADATYSADSAQDPRQVPVLTTPLGCAILEPEALRYAISPAEGVSNYATFEANIAAMEAPLLSECEATFPPYVRSAGASPLLSDSYPTSCYTTETDHNNVSDCETDTDSDYDSVSMAPLKPVAVNVIESVADCAVEPCERPSPEELLAAARYIEATTCLPAKANLMLYELACVQAPQTDVDFRTCLRLCYALINTDCGTSPFREQFAHRQVRKSLSACLLALTVIDNSSLARQTLKAVLTETLPARSIWKEYCDNTVTLLYRAHKHTEALTRASIQAQTASM